MAVRQVSTENGTSPTITVTGVNDAAVIDGQTSGSVTEATKTNPGVLGVTGVLTVADLDDAESAFAAGSGDATYGSYSIDKGGNWTYTLDNGNATVDGLKTGQTLADSFTVASVDGTEQVVNITINGQTDNAGPPTGIVFNLTQNGNALQNIGTFVAVGDPDGPAETFTWSSTGSSAHVTVDPLTGQLSAGAQALTGSDLTVKVAVTDSGGNTISAQYHLVIGTQQADALGLSFIVEADGNATIAYGGGGGDTITGTGNGDYITGSAGNDTIVGGGGADIMTGGSGNDVFRYIAASDSTAAAMDTILGFDAGTDKINFHGLGLSSTVNNGATPGSGQVGWVSAGGDTTVYANTLGGAMQIYLQGTGSITSADFLLTS